VESNKAKTERKKEDNLRSSSLPLEIPTGPRHPSSGIVGFGGRYATQDDRREGWTRRRCRGVGGLGSASDGGVKSLIFDVDGSDEGLGWQAEGYGSGGEDLRRSMCRTDEVSCQEHPLVSEERSRNERLDVPCLSTTNDSL
jgi:hypothetical protein